MRRRNTDGDGGSRRNSPASRPRRRPASGLAALVGASAVLIAVPDQASFREPTPLAQLLGTAHLVVIGAVIAATSDSFLLAPEEGLRGSMTADPLAVATPRRDATEPRWRSLGKGQRLLLFLRRAEVDAGSGAPAWHLAGLGGDGELPVDDCHVYLVGHFVEGLDLQRYEVQGATVTAQRVARHTFRAALESYGECFSWSEPTQEAPAAPRQTCDTQQLTAFEGRSPLHRRLARETLARIQVRERSTVPQPTGLGRLAGGRSQR